MSPSKKLCDVIEDINKLILDLENIDIEIEVEDQALILLTPLTSSYENVVETLLYWRKSLTMEDVLTTLNSRELKKRIVCAKEEIGDGVAPTIEKALVVVRNDEMTELVMGSDSRISTHLYSNPNTDPGRMPLTKAK
ncbi:hypothetical protein Tco_0338822, partial [Tanacetum coccineum]